MARKDNWTEKKSAVGHTAAIHEYFVFVALSCKDGPLMWKSVPGAYFCDSRLLTHRTAKVLKRASLVPAHGREPHPSVRLFLLMLHPQPLSMVWAWSQKGMTPRRRAIQGFSAGVAEYSFGV